LTDEAAGGSKRGEGKANRRRVTILVVLGLLALVLVALFGWYQFGHRAARPIDTIRNHAIPGTDLTIGEGVLDFVKNRGIKVVGEGFKPSWGAEETEKDVWVVSYVFEVGRGSQRVSWKVYSRTGRVFPRGEMARELWYGK